MKEVANWLSAIIAYSWFNLMWVMEVEEWDGVFPIQKTAYKVAVMIIVTRILIAINKWQRNKLRYM